MRSESFSSHNLLKVTAITLSFGLVALGHELTGVQTHGEHVIHVLLRSAYLIPLILCAIWYGVAGGLAGVGVVTLLFVIHIRHAWENQPWENANQFAMVGAYWVIGLLTGVLISLQRRAERLRRRARERLERDALISSLRGLEAALKFRDEYTARHGEAVASLAADIARRLDLPAERIQRVRLAGRVHDLGKIGIRDDVLYKPERLSTEEKGEMRVHPQIAADILAAASGTAPIAEIVRAHHEYLDGSGYPKGLRGGEIPIEAQILTVADVFCALTEERPYHSGRSSEEALAFLASWAPGRVEDEIVAALRACIFRQKAAAGRPDTR